MPSTVAVHLATEDDRAYTTLQWQQGRVHAIDDTGMIPEAFTLFDLLHDMPLVADIQHMAQRHLGVEGVFAPDLDTATLWIEDEAVLVEARLHDVHDSIRLRVNGATLTRA